MHPSLQQLHEAIAGLQGVDWAGEQADSLRSALLDLDGLRAALDGVAADLTATFDRSGAWRSDGARSLAAWLAQKGRTRSVTARDRALTARRLVSMPITRAALARGEITSEHVAVLARANRPEVAEQFVQAEAALVEAAKHHDFDAFRRAVRYWSDVTDPLRARSDAEAKVERRSFHWSRALDDMGRLEGWLDPLGYSIVAQELGRIEQELFRADWAAARAQHGPAATTEHLPRTQAQRRADALVEMATRSASTPADSRRPEPLLYVHVDWATFCAELASLGQPEASVEAGTSGSVDGAAEAPAPAGLLEPVAPLPPDDNRRTGTPPGGRLCELDDGTVILPSQALALGVRGSICRVVFGSAGQVLDLGRARRFFTGAVRRALFVRDRGCATPGCDVPARWCQADHLIPWWDGGTTSERNGVLRCGHHNRNRSGEPPPNGPP